MGRAYGMPIPQTTDGPQIAAAERAAEDALHGWYAGPPPEVLWRVEAVSYSYTVDADREEYGSTDPRLEIFPLEVLRFTEQGATLRETTGARNRWVDLRPGAKQYASRTVAEAVEQFASRRRAQIYILQRQLARAERELALTQPQVVGVAPAPAAPIGGLGRHGFGYCGTCGTERGHDYAMGGAFCPNPKCDRA